jgi:dUTP pyrophosphatase
MKKLLNGDIWEQDLNGNNMTQTELFSTPSFTANVEGVTYKMKELAEMNVKIKKLHSDAIIPVYAKDGDAGMDIVATEIIKETDVQITYGTGIALEIPKGYVGLVFPRSSIRKKGLELSNSVGVIDSGYRGEIQATFNKTVDYPDTYKVGERICQIMILPYPSIRFVEVEELGSSDRGEGGFGSTGN